MNCSPLIDSHCHLDYLTQPSDLEVTLARSRNQGVCAWLVPGITPVAWPAIQRLATAYPGVYPAYGVHPLWVECWSLSVAEDLRRRATTALAVGEIGLDYAERQADRERQRQVFRAQLQIARQAGLPVLLHCRRAFADLLTIVREEGVSEYGGIMHAFSGSPEVARECVRLGLFIGIAGPVTYQGARRLPEVVASVGLSRLVLETDAPDLTPEPLRGAENRPENLPLIARKVASLCHVDVATVAARTTANLRHLLRLPEADQDVNVGEKMPA